MGQKWTILRKGIQLARLPLQFKELTVDEIRALNHPYSWDKLAAMEKRENEGSRFFALIEQEKTLLVFGNWWEDHAFYEENFGQWLTLEKGQVYNQEIATNPKFRVRGLARYFLDCVFLHYKKKGSKSEIHFIDAANFPSIRLDGPESKPVRTYLCLVWGGLTRYSWLLKDREPERLGPGRFPSARRQQPPGSEK